MQRLIKASWGNKGKKETEKIRNKKATDGVEKDETKDTKEPRCELVHKKSLAEGKENANI